MVEQQCESCKCYQHHRVLDWKGDEVIWQEGKHPYRDYDERGNPPQTT